MRRILALLIFGVVVTSSYNAVNLIAIGSTGMLVWALVFSVGVPILAIAQALSVARSETGPTKFRPSALILSGVILAQATMMPLAERLREHAEQVEHP